MDLKQNKVLNEVYLINNKQQKELGNQDVSIQDREKSPESNEDAQQTDRIFMGHGDGSVSVTREVSSTNSMGSMFTDIVSGSRQTRKANFC
jgi:GMP synthase-like glutamine amidotransferase